MAKKTYKQGMISQKKSPSKGEVRPVDFSTGSNVVIRVENLWKEYRLGAINHGTLAQDLNSLWAKIRGKEDPNQKLDSTIQQLNDALEKPDRFWALRDVSFDIKQGEVLGIIGKNGAGKSTLLKIFSKVTSPTKGQVNIKGRVASLLEVGTGFHPELTGRENVFLNGAILGMSKQEIYSKFDEILAFSEIEKFIDTPVKRYSSGMYVRLAFAVAAHLEPETLIVDEVLAVGDAQFQKKCLGKMKEVGKEGRTVLFVSHNMQAIRQLCSRAIHFNDGQVCADAGVKEVVGSYLYDENYIDKYKSIEEVIAALPVDPVFCLKSIVLMQNGKPIDTVVESGLALEIVIHYDVLVRTSGLRVYVDLCDNQDLLLVRSFHDEKSEGIPVMGKGHYVSRMIVPANTFGPTTYELRIKSGIYNVRNCLPPAGIRLPISVVPTGNYNKAYVGDAFRGELALSLPWLTKKED